MKWLGVFVLVAFAVVIFSACASGNTTSTTTPKIKVTFISVSTLTESMILDLSPSSGVRPNQVYFITLYIAGKMYSKTSVNWSQADLNVRNQKSVAFRLSYEDANAYRFADEAALKKIVSIKVEVQ